GTTGTPRAMQIRLSPVPTPAPGTPVDYGGLTWSPDGSQLAFLCCSNWWNHTWLYVMNPDGTSLRRVHHGIEGDSIRWSPDGRKIAFSTGFNLANWQVMSSDGTGVRRICVRCWITWLPHSSKIAYSRGRIIVVDADGSHRRAIAGIHSGRYESF